jgi:SAM-dependent methyltransferase
MRQRESASLNRLCDISDWRLGPFHDVLSTLNWWPHIIHRKQWEYTLCILGLEKTGVVTPSASAIAVGAGSENPLYYFANKVDRMLATDVYGKYPGNEAPADMLTKPEKYAPFEYRRGHLEVEYADALTLPYPESSFDFGFSLSSIEHFGGPEQTETAMREIHRVLKPGGVFCIVTELILTLGTIPHAYTVEQIQRHLIDSTPLYLVEKEIDLTISESLLEHPIDLEQEMNLRVSPHIVLKSQGELFTSLILFFRKPQ